MNPCERLDIYLYTYCEINKADLVRARMHVYKPGSTIPDYVYTSSDRLHTFANPIEADYFGKFPKLFIDKPYRICIHDKDGIMIFQDEYEL